MSTHTARFIAILAAGCAIALPVAASHADSDSPAIRVSYQDLNLGTTAGVAALYQRIGKAAGAACDSTRQLTGTRVSKAYDRCVDEAIASTVKQIGLPSLTALHATRSGATSG
jgi:UrcA family protein